MLERMLGIIQGKKGTKLLNLKRIIKPWKDMEEIQNILLNEISHQKYLHIIWCHFYSILEKAKL